MALDLTGISNQNEFYAQHYLSAILENDLKDLFDRWRKEEEEKKVRPPYDRLGALRRDYFAVRGEMDKARHPEQILQCQRRFLPHLLDALGYVYRPATVSLDNDELLPVVCEIKKTGGAPDLWVIEASCPSTDIADPLDLELSDAQYGDGGADGEKLLNIPLEEIITKSVFGMKEPPRWIVLATFFTLILIDRSKWNEKRLLRFDIQQIMDRREPATLRAMAALLHRQSIIPEEGRLSLLDTLDENSHRHAFSVSEDLKYTVREAVELLGNEAIWYLREKRKKGVFGETETAEEVLPQELTEECLRYMYRMLFLFYLEARPDEVGYAPMRAEAYRKGYSLESLRELELTPLTTDESKNGFYLYESLKTLFRIVFEGFNLGARQAHLALSDSPQSRIQNPKSDFTLASLQSHLFNPERTQLLNRVKFRNFVLQRVLELLSLSRPRGGRERRGRISYAQLGINQLGAVYEGLLSYRGFFAETDLYEVKKADEEYDELKQAFFVKEEDLAQYNENERVYNADGTPKKFPKGTFIYRLAGRDREKSASYYTPHVLTRCLVKYALKELLKGGDGEMKADDILRLKVCEMALGSAAFLNEAIDQLADEYLRRKQKELNEAIPHDQYMLEKQKVKMYLADNNVFGVDLNPVAVELAEVSLWLNTIHAGAYVPWFGLQLATGNSLIGARRQVFDAGLLGERKPGENSWLDEAPTRVQPGEKRPNHRVYHFLVPDKGMADYADKIIRGLVPQDMDRIKAWRRAFCKPFAARDVDLLEKLSASVDKLWKRHTEQLRKLREDTADPVEVFGQKKRRDADGQSYQLKDKKLFQELLSRNVRNSSPYRRLKMVMDYWCALWFWPIQKSALLPSRDEFLMDLQLILEGSMIEMPPEQVEQMLLFAETIPRQEQLKLVQELGFVDVDGLCQKIERLNQVQEIAERFRFLHWELEFSDVFEDNGGFNLIVGNPPWIRVEWNESGILGDYQPLFVLKNLSSARLAEIRNSTIQARGIINEYLAEYVEATATQNFYSATQNFPVLSGQKCNLYKCFLPLAWAFAGPAAVVAFLHPEGVFDDTSGGSLRCELYPRLRYHFQFQNELKLFADIGNREKFSVNIYSHPTEVSIRQISNLFHPMTIDQCFANSGEGRCQGIKTEEEGGWNLAGHRDRIIQIEPTTLAMFARVYDEVGTPGSQARLPVIHSRHLVDVIQKFAGISTHLSDAPDSYVAGIMWDETKSLKMGVLREATRFPDSPEHLIFSGPHIHVANPVFQTPKLVCETHRAYDGVDLGAVPADYLPRTNFIPSGDTAEYRRRIACLPWSPDVHSHESCRLVFRRRLSQAGERTLLACISAPLVGSIHGIVYVAFSENERLVEVAGVLSSLCLDFWLKSTGKSDFLPGDVDYLPLFEGRMQKEPLLLRTMSLNCLTSEYATLWRALWRDGFCRDRWTRDDPRLPSAFFAGLGPEWERGFGLRTEYARRQCLVEIDVIVARALDLTLDELCNIYRVQFPVLQENDEDTWFDRNGRIAFTCSKGLPGVGFSRPEWDRLTVQRPDEPHIRDLRDGAGTVERAVTVDFMPDFRKAHGTFRLKEGKVLQCPCPDYPEPIAGPVEQIITYVAPFDRCDREQDYATAWKEFEKRGIK